MDKIQKYKKLAIASFALTIITIVFFINAIALIITIVTSGTNFDFFYNLPMGIFAILFGVLFIVIGLVESVLSLICSIWTLTGDWPVNDDKKLLWGLLSLLLLGSIGTLVFAYKISNASKQADYK